MVQAMGCRFSVIFDLGNDFCEPIRIAWVQMCVACVYGSLWKVLCHAVLQDVRLQFPAAKFDVIPSFEERGVCHHKCLWGKVKEVVPKTIHRGNSPFLWILVNCGLHLQWGESPANQWF